MRRPVIRSEFASIEEVYDALKCFWATATADSYEAAWRWSCPDYEADVPPGMGLEHVCSGVRGIIRASVMQALETGEYGDFASAVSDMFIEASFMWDIAKDSFYGEALGPSCVTRERHKG